ncbi:DNA polymerase IV (family X) [Phaffia rhodozyma]|uniref:DNA polymerase n=1 Tax=Phaffia rhodozyma TaxID=264483 RepID=A0A0F7SFU3_PHARH|nr:DNA polymerase IV (family X) [Phaffia rhodozyma]
MPNILGYLKIYIIPTKYSPSDIRQLSAELTIHGGQLIDHPERADIILTRLMGRKRLALALDPTLIDSKIVVLDRWLADCIAHEALLDHRPYLVPPDHSSQPTHKWPRKQTASPSTRPPNQHNNTRSPSDHNPFKTTSPALILASFPATEKSIEPSTLPRLACCRKSPSICINQLLIEELDVIRVWKENGEDDTLESDLNQAGKKDDEKHALAYSRACSALKAYPTKICSVSEAQVIPFIGPKIALQIGEYLSTGQIKLSQTLRTSVRLRSILLFQTLHGVGSRLSREFYDIHDCRTLEDVANARPSLKVQVTYWSDLQTPIPRYEVPLIAKFLSDELEMISPGCIHTICGSYRRGREYSNDVDIVFTYPAMNRSSKVSSQVLDQLVDRLRTLSALTDILSGSSIGSNALRGLHQRFIMMSLPRQTRQIRVDIIFAPYEIYWVCVVGWTGSTMFERDIRKHANGLNLKFASHGISRLSDGSEIAVSQEKGEPAVFEALGLEWIEPTERNADV